MKNCELPKCFPVSLDDNINYSNHFPKKSIENFNSTYACPEGWLQAKEDASNGTCTLPACFSPWDRPVARSFKYSYGPKYGGYPISRRSAADFCVDLGNGNDYSNAFKDKMSAVWPPADAATAVAIAQGDVNNKSQTASGYAGSASHAAAVKADAATVEIQKATTPPEQVLAAAQDNLNAGGGASSVAGAAGDVAADGSGAEQPVAEAEWIKGVPNKYVMIGGAVAVVLLLIILLK